MLNAEMTYISYVTKVLGVKYIQSERPEYDNKLTIIFDKNLNVQEQLVFTKIVEALGVNDFNSQVIAPGQSLEDVISTVPSSRIICFCEQYSQQGLIKDEGRELLYTYSISELVGQKSDKQLLERKKQTWHLLKKFL